MEQEIIIDKNRINEFCKLNDLILINEKIAQENNMLIYLPYATKNNFLGKSIYPKDMPVLINADVWQNLIKANTELNEHGIKIIIYDAYRPINVQYLFWECYKNMHGDNVNEYLVANPEKYGTHNIKIPAIDIIPAYINNNELINLPCEFDNFSENASTNMNLFKEHYPELYLLINTLDKYNLVVNPSEFWHFTRKDIMQKYGLEFNFKKEKSLIPKLDTEIFKLSTK